MKTTQRDELATIKIAGWQKLSLIDYPGKMAAVIFLAGCNMRCYYCHNRQLLDVHQNQLPFMEVLAELRRRTGWLDAVVVSGGEPTVSPVLIPILNALRELGLLVKLDTNGTQPEIVRRVIENGLVDYVALDVKAPVAKHVAITGTPIEQVLKTVRFLKSQKHVPYMLRTTVSPLLNEEDLQEIGAKIIHGANCWQIQQCRIKNAYSSEKIKAMAINLKTHALDIVVKGV